MYFAVISIFVAEGLEVTLAVHFAIVFFAYDNEVFVSEGRSCKCQMLAVYFAISLVYDTAVFFCSQG